MHTEKKLCRPPSWARRPHFRKGQKLTAERFNRLYELQAHRLRQALLGVAGAGVVYGFDNRRDRHSGYCAIDDHGRIEIGCGLAIVPPSESFRFVLSTFMVIAPIPDHYSVAKNLDEAIAWVESRMEANKPPAPA